MASKGEELVRTKFNPNGNTLVDKVKTRFAEIIDLIDENVDKDPRLAAIAITQTEEAAMWAVKLVTTEPKKEHVNM